MTREWNQFNNEEKRYLLYKILSPYTLILGVGAIFLLFTSNRNILVPILFIILLIRDVYKFIRGYNRIKNRDHPLFYEERRNETI